MPEDSRIMHCGIFLHVVLAIIWMKTDCFVGVLMEFYQKPVAIKCWLCRDKNNICAQAVARYNCNWKKNSINRILHTVYYSLAWLQHWVVYMSHILRFGNCVAVVVCKSLIISATYVRSVVATVIWKFFNMELFNTPLSLGLIEKNLIILSLSVWV